jgi:hypothetical protein
LILYIYIVFPQMKFRFFCNMKFFWGTMIRQENRCIILFVYLMIIWHEMMSCFYLHHRPSEKFWFFHLQCLPSIRFRFFCNMKFFRGTMIRRENGCITSLVYLIIIWHEMMPHFYLHHCPSENFWFFTFTLCSLK